MNIKKKIVGDMVFNIIATAIPIALLQLVIYPIVAQRIPANDYGIMVTIFSFLQLVCGTLGTGLNNVRLLKDSDYKKKEVCGDFNYLMMIYYLVVFLAMIVGARVYQGYWDFVSILLLALTSAIYLSVAYLEVDFRIKLDFKGILVKEIFSAVGYCMGLLLFFITNLWQFIFMFGYAVPLIYILFKTDLHKEPREKTELFPATLRDSLYIDLSGLCSRAMSYADKMLLLPLVGGSNVAIYYTATLLGKIVLMGMNPINSVILSYINKINKLSSKAFRTYFCVGAGVCIIGYFCCIIISRPILSFLFPQWVDEAMTYVPITTLSLCISTLCNFLTPLTLKFCNMHWQLTINVVTLFTYVVFSVVFYNLYGLVGFCCGIVCSYAVKLCVICLVYCKKSKK